MVQSPKMSSSSIQNFIRVSRQRPVDALALVFLMSMSYITYFYSALESVPTCMANYPNLLYFFFQPGALWLIIAITLNMYFIRTRTSTIQNKILVSPTIFKDDGAGDCDQNQEVEKKTKSLGQQFLAEPFNKEDAWHICANCEVFVPPRTWHCVECGICIIRRDHHCIFAMTCIGQENHHNFMGLVFYLVVGTFCASVFNMYYLVNFHDMALWWYFIRGFTLIYCLIWDYSLPALVGSVNLLGFLLCLAVLVLYVMLAAQGQTAADKRRKLSRTLDPNRLYSYKNFVNFLGPNPILRIIWPFYKTRLPYVVQNGQSYSSKDL